MISCVLLLMACGKSYEETKREAAENRREAMRRDSSALKVAVLPTLDCLPLYVAEYYQLFDSVHGGVRLKHFNAQMDCDTAIERGRVEGSSTGYPYAATWTKTSLCDGDKCLLAAYHQSQCPHSSTKTVGRQDGCYDAILIY